MMISTKGRYAPRFLVDVAEHQGGGVPLKDVAAPKAGGVDSLSHARKRLTSCPHRTIL